MKRVFLAALFVCGNLISNGQDLLPKSTTGQVIRHSQYTLSYSEEHEQAEWVYYFLNLRRISSGTRRTDNFRIDPLVKTGSATLTDYKGSGYDRGHLSPAADNTNGQEFMSESFFMSNMSPQAPSFNRGIWSKLERQVRGYAIGHEGIHVVTAGILRDNLKSIGPNHVSIPQYFYKVLYDDKKQIMIAFLLENKGSQQPLDKFVVSVDSIEVISGVDFFPSLPDSLENILESSSDISLWKAADIPTNAFQPKSGAAEQCRGIAKSTGVQCKNRTTNTNGYCHLHQSQANGTKVNRVPARRTTSVQCSGTTKAGNRCKNKTLNASGRCYLHDK